MPKQTGMWLTLLLVFLFIAPHVRAEDKLTPTIKVSADGFPVGHETPEGVAADLARAFIGRDVNLFDDTCIKPFTGGQSREEYSAFLKETVENIRNEAQRKESVGPKEILKVFAARSLSRNGPASYGFAAFGFQDVKFVDVLTLLHNGKKHENRTLVIKDKAGKWYVHPLPGSSPLLSIGLNDESESKIEFAEVYKVQK